MSTQVLPTNLHGTPLKNYSPPRKTSQIHPLSTHPTIQDIPKDLPDAIIISIPITCSICICEYLPEELKSSLPCKHTFCSTCLSEYLHTKIHANEILNIPCPQVGCQELFTEKVIKDILPTSGYNRYQDLAVKKLALNGPKRHYCPQPGCSRPLKLTEEQEFSVCECEAKVCNACNNLYHEGKTCVETMDVEFQVYAKENGVRFCMMCKTIIMKEEGCNTIKCAVCDYKWCWLCGNEYDPKHCCDGKWSPIPPASIRQADFKGRMKKLWGESSLMKRIGICLGLVLASPLILLGFIVAFPTFYIRDGEEETGGVESKNPCVRVLRIIVIGIFTCQ